MSIGELQQFLSPVLLKRGTTISKVFRTFGQPCTCRPAFCRYVFRFQELYAEVEGFEPPVHLRAQRFSRPPHSTALAHLQE